ncbi:hypothetical protein C8J57DRAFT_1355611 [Mycena rebaudengoi]|nr:hypothetical protein C8J57DRAFT_1355611 [Mycena rebaudengoi]
MSRWTFFHILLVLSTTGLFCSIVNARPLALEVAQGHDNAVRNAKLIRETAFYLSSIAAGKTPAAKRTDRIVVMAFIAALVAYFVLPLALMVITHIWPEIGRFKLNRKRAVEEDLALDVPEHLLRMRVQYRPTESIPLRHLPQSSLGQTRTPAAFTDSEPSAQAASVGENSPTATAYSAESDEWSATTAVPAYPPFRGFI